MSLWKIRGCLVLIRRFVVEFLKFFVDVVEGLLVFIVPLSLVGLALAIYERKSNVGC